MHDAAQLVRSIEEAFKRNGYGDIASHADELVELAQQIRSETATLPRSGWIRMLVDRVQQAAHELEHTAKAQNHEDSHHAFNNLKDELESLDQEVQALL